MPQSPPLHPTVWMLCGHPKQGWPEDREQLRGKLGEIKTPASSMPQARVSEEQDISQEAFLLGNCDFIGRNLPRVLFFEEQSGMAPIHKNEDNSFMKKEVILAYLDSARPQWCLSETGAQAPCFL